MKERQRIYEENNNFSYIKTTVEMKEKQLKTLEDFLTEE